MHPKPGRQPPKETSMAVLSPALSRRRPPRGTAAPQSPQVLEVVTPRTNAATITPAENFLAALSLRESFSLEIAATRTARWFLVRAGSAAMRRHLEEQLAAAYPQATLRPLDAAHIPAMDPARCRPDDHMAACALILQAPPYLPLRTFRDVDLAADRAA